MRPSVEPHVGQIGYFQLANLVRNKVPFSLFSMDINVPSNLPSDLPSIAKLMTSTTVSRLLSDIKALNLKADHPLVLLCDSGVQSAGMATQLANQGFLNVYVVRGGWQSLYLEAQQG
jgi:rhodanese-related sulfurtransferase